MICEMERRQPETFDWRPPPRVKVPVIPGPLAGDPIWYEDPNRKQLHLDLVLVGLLVLVCGLVVGGSRSRTR
jgi:hypothetical protein